MPLPDRNSVALQIKEWQKLGLKVGFTSGVFDLVHVGHLDYLLQSKKVCDRLVVAINSDASVRSNKGPRRPIVPAEQRAELIAGLKPVDLAFVFEELNNNLNIEVCRPDVYIKAGDYDISRLSSAPLIQAYGGSVKLIPLVNSTSTSDTIESILSKYVPQHNSCPDTQARPCVFLDRDGVINKEIGYLHQPEQFELADGVIEGLQKLSQAGFALVLVTNQAGIGLGYFSHEDFYNVNRAMFRAIAPSKASFDRIYYCPHGLNDHCDCRKPKTGMIERGFKELNLIRESSWMVGDLASDIEAGRNAGLKTILVSEQNTDAQPHHHCMNLNEAADFILAHR
jgi:D-glycero-D-manno-heptose 1,7-bisphosphate phosphatase